MNDHPSPNVVAAVRAFYQENPDAERLFDWTASLERDASETTIRRMRTKLQMSRGAAISLARGLEAAGCGEFIVGRRGSPSRFRWAYSRVSLGLAASGEIEELTEAYETISETEEEASETLSSERHLTIPEAKERLARTLDVEPHQISIEINA